jgi:hypothetical protein
MFGRNLGFCGAFEADAGDGLLRIQHDGARNGFAVKPRIGTHNKLAGVTLLIVPSILGYASGHARTPIVTFIVTLEPPLQTGVIHLLPPFLIPTRPPRRRRNPPPTASGTTHRKAARQTRHQTPPRRHLCLGSSLVVQPVADQLPSVVVQPVAAQLPSVVVQPVADQLPRVVVKL